MHLMSAEERPVLAALARAAVELTGAEGAAVLAVRGEDVVVLAGARLGSDDGAVRFVLAGGQPLSLVPADGRGDAPATLCLPCLGGDAVVGALELHGRAGAGPFDAAATRVGALLVDVVGAELTVERRGSAGTPSPAQLGAELAELAARDRVRYDAIAQGLGALLAGG